MGDLIADETDKKIAAEIATKIRLRITPQIVPNGTTVAGDPMFKTFGLDGCTYVWTVSDANAHAAVVDNVVTIHGGARPMTLTCVATDTVSGVQASSVISV